MASSLTATMDSTLTAKEAELKSLLLSHDSVAVAFSGGVDSTLLLDVAHEVLGSEAVAITAAMVGLPARDLEATREFCAKRGVRQLEVEFDELALDGFANNPPDRCYLCKRALFTALLALVEKSDISVLVEGSNLDDEQDYRPGRAALKELGISSPLKAAGFTKADIRALSQARGLPTWDKPACACLSTRLPFGAPLTRELLKRIDEAEQCVQDAGAKQVRVRVHDSLARIEVDEESLPLFMQDDTRHCVNSALQKLGFVSVALDLQGYRMGSMNSSLSS
ncbi:MAG: ATP-dependent sacrificial sulfur transferase LarE [Coriobacteriales bacterium]|jgi:uncharacterized protein|nr:ATP-dependent sacrificial sulfur transferase LarE [Coriobacteriales bacterium]